MTSQILQTLEMYLVSFIVYSNSMSPHLQRKDLIGKLERKQHALFKKLYFTAKSVIFQ